MLDPRTIWSTNAIDSGGAPAYLAGILILVAAAVAALLAHLVLIGIVRHVVGTRRFFLAALVVQVVIEFA